MNKVLTRKEYNRIKKSPGKDDKVKQERVKDPTPAKPKPKAPRTIYVLYHPENPQGNPLNKTILIHVKNGNGEELRKVHIVNGAVKTEDIKVKERLVQMGYDLLGEKTIPRRTHVKAYNSII